MMTFESPVQDAKIQHLGTTREWAQTEPEWRCWINGSCHIGVFADKAPNAFQRWMQQLVFGFRWERRP